ncbi:hypothetical protein Phou_071290 [Phytohabitans houttuyneae]|uniref:Lipoyl-binding domain-containing protein n=1 Tax=Phytohabitans houttuyneae TaxID=1076126 RepID=A0A6V8KL86_9ACTN|nr:hypothetical protein Phou_071290 [Phytohabitans houttuyneae]
MSTQQFRLPDLGEGLTEAEVLRWLVQVGDTVAVDQPVVEVETAKASVEVPSPYGGVVAELHAAEGGTVDVGAPLISITTGAPSSSGNVLVGYGTAEVRRTRRGRRRPAAATAAPANGARPLVISPIVRKLARDHHVDLATLTGTAPGGVIARRDVEQAIAAAPRRRRPPRARCRCVTGCRCAACAALWPTASPAAARRSRTPPRGWTWTRPSLSRCAARCSPGTRARRSASSRSSRGSWWPASPATRT